MRIKRTFILLLLCVSFTSTVFAADISLNINGVPVESEALPQIIDGRTMVPVRTIFEGVGASVEWYPTTKAIVGTKDGITVTMNIGVYTGYIDDQPFKMDVAPQIIDGRTYAPAKYVAEAFGYEVSWDSDTKTVNIYNTGDSNNKLGISYDRYTEMVDIYNKYLSRIKRFDAIDDAVTFINEDCALENSNFNSYINNPESETEKYFALALYYAVYCLALTKGLDIEEVTSSTIIQSMPTNFNECLADVGEIFKATSDSDIIAFVEMLNTKYDINR